MSKNNTQDSNASVQESTLPHYPPHFLSGSLICLANGAIKKVEELTTEDFVESASLSGDLKVDASIVIEVMPITSRGTVQLSFLVRSQKIQVTVESTWEHPFFVFGKGWSSCSPERTLQRYKLKCSQLQVGDECISLAKKDYSVPPNYDTPHAASNNKL